MNFQFDKILMTIGFLIFLIGFLIYIFNKLGLTIGKLPGDIYYKNGNFTFYFPLTTGIIISIIITIILNIIIKFFK